MNQSIKNVTAAVNAKVVIMEGLEELQEWVDDGMISLRSANLIRLNAENHLRNLQALNDAFDVGEAVRNLIDAYYLNEHVGPDCQLDPVQDNLWKNREYILI